MDLEALRVALKNQAGILCYFPLGTADDSVVAGDRNVGKEEVVSGELTPLPHTVADTVTHCTTRDDLKHAIGTPWSNDDVTRVSVATKLQNKCNLWHEYRYGHVTASIAMHCAQTVNLPEKRITRKTTSFVKKNNSVV